MTENLQDEAGEDAKMTEKPASILRILRECPARYAKSRCHQRIARAGESYAFSVGKSCKFVQYAAFFGHSASLAGDADRQDDLLLCVLPLGVRGDPSIADKGEIVFQGIQK